MTRKLVTKGEELFEFIRAEVSTPPRTVAMAIPEFARRSNHLLEFVDGVVLLHTHARIMRLARTVRDRDDLPSDMDEADSLKKTLLEVMDIGASTCSNIDTLINLAIESAKRVDKPINPTTKREVVGLLEKRGKGVHCYICNEVLDPTAAQYLVDPILAEIADPALRTRVQDKLPREENNNFLEFDHLWPNSLGGDSSAENLLPICPACNRKKDDMASWEWALVQSTVLPPLAYSPQALTRVRKQVKIALFMRAAFLIAEDSKTSLKDAYLALGPKEEARVVQDTDTTDFFNMEVHNSANLASLWRI